ncbi:hypothetical protein L1987_16552 [Smallanthus sonchifolius]|uniref:Uncharacterized protein n=1 Tax=Smallanthus sonchifolius TaxID=185202 RepID=A0ACB9J9M5_9ASTR|nr:hypothetical protein L1987_16552 [Smallanthus sonchifolius]
MERPRGIQFLYELNLFTGTDIGRLFPLRWNPANLNNCLYIKQGNRLTPRHLLCSILFVGGMRASIRRKLQLEGNRLTPRHLLDDERGDPNPGQMAPVDEFLKERAEKAIIEAMKSYEPRPEEVTKTFTEQVSEYVSNLSLSLQNEQAPRKQLKKPSNRK